MPETTTRMPRSCIFQRIFRLGLVRVNNNVEKTRRGRSKTQQAETTKTIPKGAKMQQRRTQNAPKRHNKNSRKTNQRAPSKRKYATERQNQEKTNKPRRQNHQRTPRDNKNAKKNMKTGADPKMLNFGLKRQFQRFCVL